VGCLLLTDHPGEDQCGLVYMGVVPEFRGRGIGRRMIRFAQRAGAAAGRSRLVVGVDMANKAAMEALMSIEGFRNLNQEIETIINKSEAVKKARKEKNDEEMTKEEKRELTAEEKEFKSKRKQIQEKLIKFATRVPIFMYLTDFRERCLKDVITQLEPGLFKKVTGLTVKDFELLVSLGVFNSALMNDAVYKFKRYEDASLSYTGINKHEGEEIGLYDTVLSSKDYQQAFVNEPIVAFES